jgi:hypothetical protein
MMLFVGAVAAFMLGYLLFAKFFPLISIWEIREGREEAVETVTERVKSYQPGEEEIVL